MAVELPEPLQWVLLLLAGCRWPEADEGVLRDMAEHCRQAASDLTDAAASSDAAIKRALDGQQGRAAEALGTYWARYATGKGTQEEPGYLPGAVNSLNAMGDMLEQMANSAETAKIQIVAQLGILAFEIATAEAEAPFTAGASLLEVPVMVGASRAVVSAILKTLLKEMIEMAAKQAAQMAAINLLAQGIEVAEGHRKGLDMKELGQNALGGAVGGASGHLIGKGIGGAGAKLGAERALNSTVGKMATGAAVGVGADVSTQLITTGKVDGESLLGSGLSGGAGAGLHAGASAIKGHLNAPKPGETPHLDGLDSAPTFSKPTSRSLDGGYHGPSGEGGGGSTSRSLDDGNASGTSGGSSPTLRSSSSAGSDGSRVNGLSPFGSARAVATPSEGGTEHPASAATVHGTESGSSGGERARSIPTTPHESTLRQETGVQQPLAQESTPRQTQPSHEPVAQRSMPEPTTVRPDASPVTPHEPTLRQESTVNEPVAQRSMPEPTTVRPDATPVTPHEPTPALHEPPAQRTVQEPTARLDQPTVSQEPVSQRPAPELVAHEDVPTQSQSPHTAAPVDRSGPEGTQPERTQENAPRQEQPVRSEETRPSAPVHEQSPAAVGASSGHAAPSVVREPVAVSSDIPSQRGSATPNPSGLGSHTNIDGGTRIAGGQAPVRTDQEQAPGNRTVPEAATPSTASQNPAATAPPTGNGFMLGPVAGGGPAGHRGSGEFRPGSDPASAASAPKPLMPQGSATSQPGGGTIRPGTGREANSHPTLPRRTAPTDNQLYDSFREFMDRVDGDVSPTPNHQQPPKAEDTTGTALTPTAHQPVPEAAFPPPGPRVTVAGDGLCLLNSLDVSTPGLTGQLPAGSGGAARRLQSAVEHHFDNLPSEHWPSEVVANYRGHVLSRPDLTANDLLAYLPVDVRDGYAGLPLTDLRQIVGDHLVENSPPPTPREREALMRTVRDWRDRWLTTEGEMLPAAAAHALDLRMRVLGHDGTPLAVFGPPDGRQVTVYHQGNHYDGSQPVTPAPPVTHTPSTTPESPKAPAPEASATKPVPPKDPVPEKPTSQSPAPKAPAPEKPTPNDPAPEKPTNEPEAPKGPASEETGTKPTVEPEPEVKPDPEAESKPEPKPEPEPLPSTSSAPRPIAADDLVVGLTGNEAAVRQKVIDVLAGVVPGDRAAARAFADTHFGPATLRPMLSALSRGETWTVPLDGNGYSGNIRLRGEVTGSTRLRTEKIEFENGADRTVTIGSGRDSQWQYNIGAQARQSAGGAEPAELAAYFHDRGQGRVDLDLGGMVARSKTSELADVFDTRMKLELDFGALRHDHQPVTTGPGRHTEDLDLSLHVAVPVRPDGDSVGELRTPPQRLLDGRVGGQEIVLDLSPHGGAHEQRPVEALLDQVDRAAKQEFGRDWPALREKVLAEVDFPRLQRDLKSMTAGEPTTVTLTDRRGKVLGTVEISARVGDLHQTGTTKETEFNIGTTVQQVRSTATSRGNAGQFGLANTLRPAPAALGIGGAGRLGRDRIEISGDSRTAQLTSKSKVPGVRYEGPVHFEMTFNGKPDTHEAGTADVRLLVDRADTTTPDTTPEAAKPETTTPETTPPPTHEVTGPPDSVWHGGDDRGGLGETVVVRDLESTAALRTAVDAQGRERFGKDWDTVRDQVLQSFSQPNLAAKLTGMTRGEPLMVKVPGKEDLVVTATARVESMTYRREDGKAELNTVNETGAFSVDRQLLSRTVAANGLAGGAVAKATSGAPGADLFGNVSGQQRERVGGQGRQADRVYASGKYSAPQVIYGAQLAVDVHFGRPGETSGGRSDTSAPLRIEVGLDARDTVKVEVPRSEDGTVAFKPPTTPATSATSATPAEPAAHPAATPEATHTAPRRMREQHELNASYVVHSLTGADKVRSTVEDAVRSKHGEPSDEVKQKLDAAFDRVALKTQLSQLTRGGKITETVSGATWKAEVTVTARLGESTYHSKAEKYEFESGTRTSRGQGNLRDRRDRFDGGGLLRMRAPGANVAAGYAYRMDRSYGHGAETVGSASNRGKHVEPAVFFDVHTAYDVKVEFKRLGIDDGSVTTPVDTVARVAVPTRDAVPVGGPVDRTTDQQPKGFVEGRRLDSSAIVTDVHALPGTTVPAEGPRRTLGESVLSQVESGWKPGGFHRTPERPPGATKLERNPFGGDWPGLRRKLDAELTPDRLQARLKGMTAGDEIVVRHGRTTVRVGAVLRDSMEHLGDSGTTEFNTGTDVQRSFADSGGTAHGHQGRLGVTTAVPVAGGPVSVTAGVTGTGGRGQDHADVRNTSTSAGSATKAKLPGSAYRGEAELQFTFSRQPVVGASVFQRRTAAIGFETLVESGETVPVPSKSPVPPKSSDDPSAPEQPPRTLLAGPPASAEVRVPPERVWEGGLRDSDVLRFLGDVGGVQDLVRLRGPEFFGKSDWKSMEPVVGTATSHSHLSAMFGTATQGTEVSATVPTKRVTLGGGKGVEVSLKIISLEHRDTAPANESSPSNAAASGTVHSDLSAKNGGVQGQVGARITGDVTHNPAVTGGAHRFRREGGSHADAGQIISNGKYPVPMARYHGAAEVEVTLFDGNRNPVKEKGIVPFTVDIPLSDTTKVDLPGDHYLAFTPDHHGGELRSTESSGLLDDVHRSLSGGDRPFDHATATPAERDQLTGTLRVGRAAFGSEFTPRAEGGDAHIRATHRLVELSGGSSAATSAMLGDLLGAAEGTALKGEELRRVIDYVERKSAEGPVTLDDLVAGAQDGWPAQEPYDIHRETWTDHGPANELVTAAMATAAAAAGPLLRNGLPSGGQLHLTVSGQGTDLPLRQSFELTGDPARQLRTIEEATYLKPGTRPTEVTVRLAATPDTGHPWDYRITARPEGSRELTIRHPRPTEDQPPDHAHRAATTTAATDFVTARSKVPT
ncbi:hypothetical protein KCMC57_up61400 [Kitasatospora sp. CMC57]|uniref:Outer membrane channel protein CpnT-like N-terminal domain-containing protein n=1 Tax=Kitasatospora sp. CMC57 TaxID=3231513 RepID=A0AB33K4Q5_9ACTN